MDRLEELQSKATRVTTSLAISSRNGGGPQEMWNLLAEERIRLFDKMRETAAQERRVELFIARLRDPRWRTMLRLRFLNGKTVYEASRDMRYSYQSGRRLSSQAMRAARAMWQADQEADDAGM
jgi:hypothetical protein